MFQGGPLWYIRTRKLTRWQPPVLAIRRISAHVRCPEVTVMAQQTVPRKPTATATTSSLAFKSTTSSRWHTAVLYYYSMYLRRYLQAAHAHAHAWLLYNKCILLTRSRDHLLTHNRTRRDTAVFAVQANGSNSRPTLYSFFCTCHQPACAVVFRMRRAVHGRYSQLGISGSESRGACPSVPRVQGWGRLGSASGRVGGASSEEEERERLVQFP